MAVQKSAPFLLRIRDADFWTATRDQSVASVLRFRSSQPRVPQWRDLRNRDTSRLARRVSCHRLRYLFRALVGRTICGTAVGRAQPGGERRGHAWHRPWCAQLARAVAQAGVDNHRVGNRVRAWCAALPISDCHAGKARRLVGSTLVGHFHLASAHQLSGQKNWAGPRPCSFMMIVAQHHPRPTTSNRAAVA